MSPTHPLDLLVPPVPWAGEDAAAETVPAPPFGSEDPAGEDWTTTYPHPAEPGDEHEDEQDADVRDIAERVAAGGLREFEEERPGRSRRTSCFTAAEASAMVKLYEDNDTAGDAVSFDRASCIVMLNVGLGQLLDLRIKAHPARGFKPDTMSRRPRTVRMGDLTTHSIERALAQLVRAGRATGPLLIRFTDRRGRRAGTTAPQAMDGSLLDAITSRTADSGCWYAFPLSLLDGYHSVLLLVDHTGSDRRIWWMDQFSRGLSREVTTTLDAEVTAYTSAAWQSVMDRKRVGFDPTARLWRLWKTT